MKSTTVLFFHSYSQCIDVLYIKQIQFSQEKKERETGISIDHMYEGVIIITEWEFQLGETVNR
jgi:hypothetical protein